MFKVSRNKLSGAHDGPIAQRVFRFPNGVRVSVIRFSDGRALEAWDYASGSPSQALGVMDAVRYLRLAKAADRRAK